MPTKVKISSSTVDRTARRGRIMDGQARLVYFALPIWLRRGRANPNTPIKRKTNGERRATEKKIIYTDNKVCWLLNVYKEEGFSR